MWGISLLVVIAGYSCNRPEQGTAVVERVSAKTSYETQTEITLQFRVPCSARYQLYILYEKTGHGRLIDSEADSGWRNPEDGVISWKWRTDAEPQNAIALVRMSTDGADSWHSYNFSIIEKQE